MSLDCRILQCMNIVMNACQLTQYSYKAEVYESHERTYSATLCISGACDPGLLCIVMDSSANL